VTNFLTSGHIQANRAISSYLKGKKDYNFPDHEIFKGMMLAQWKHYREGRAECLNLFDSRHGSRRLRLLRLFLVRFLYERARSADSLQTPVRECVLALSGIGASEGQIIETLEQLIDYRIIRTVTSEDVAGKSTIVLTQCGGYYCQYLCRTFPYAEACLMDTAIDDKTAWTELSDLTVRIEGCGSVSDRMNLRVERMQIFTDYLYTLEKEALDKEPDESPLFIMQQVAHDIMNEAQRAAGKAAKYYSE